MKKVLLIAAVAGLAFASCKKDYTCECTYSGNATGSVSTTIKDTKKKAKDACEKLSSEAYGTTSTCKIK